MAFLLWRVHQKAIWGDAELEEISFQKITGPPADRP